MTTVKKRTFSITEEQSDFVDAKVRGGRYSSSSEVVRDALRTLEERDAAVDQWLREEVVPVMLAYEADPGRGIPATKVRQNIRRWARQAAKGRVD